jgi:hypothetical protein
MTEQQDADALRTMLVRALKSQDWGDMAFALCAAHRLLSNGAGAMDTLSAVVRETYETEVYNHDVCPACGQYEIKLGHCGSCDGTEPKVEYCNECSGSGEVRSRWMPYDMRACRDCDGTGLVNKTKTSGFYTDKPTSIEPTKTDWNPYCGGSYSEPTNPNE